MLFMFIGGYLYFVNIEAVCIEDFYTLLEEC